MAPIDIDAWLPLAQKVAEVSARRAGVEAGELLGEAWIGLRQAARTFDPARGASFKTHASRRISGQIVDAFRQETGYRLKHRVGFVSFAELADLSDGTGAYDPPARPELAWERDDDLERAIGTLSFRDQVLVGLRYENELTLREIGEILGLSESRACQLHAAVLERLRRWLSPLSLSLSLKGRAMAIAETGPVAPPCEGCGRSFLADGWKRCKRCRMGGGWQTVSPTLADEGELPASALGGACARCGRSYVKRADNEDGLCRDCASAVGKRAQGAPTRVPELRVPELRVPGGGSVEAAMPTCSNEECSRVPVAFGFCMTHLDEQRAKNADPSLPWNRFVAKKSEELKPEASVIVPERKESEVAEEIEDRRCDECGEKFTPHRKDQRFCPGGACSKTWHDKKRADEKARASKPRSPAPKPVAAERDPKPEKQEPEHDDGERYTEDDLRILLKLAELPLEQRRRLARWAFNEWAS